MVKAIYYFDSHLIVLLTRMNVFGQGIQFLTLQIFVAQMRGRLCYSKVRRKLRTWAYVGLVEFEYRNNMRLNLALYVGGNPNFCLHISSSLVWLGSIPKISFQSCRASTVCEVPPQRWVGDCEWWLRSNWMKYSCFELKSLLKWILIILR